MIQISPRLERQILLLIARVAGSEATVQFYSGALPETTDDSANGERVSSRPLAPEDMTGLRIAQIDGQTEMPEGVKSWRLLDNGGVVVMQGDGT